MTHTKKRYTATINVIDNDYRSWVGDEFIPIDSWDEAVKWCDAEDWSGHTHMIEALKDNKTGKWFNSRKEYDDNGRQR